MNFFAYFLFWMGKTKRVLSHLRSLVNDWQLLNWQPGPKFNWQLINRQILNYNWHLKPSALSRPSVQAPTARASTTRRRNFILVPMALFSSLSRWRDEKRAMGTRMEKFENITITVILDLCLRKSQLGKSRDFTLKMTWHVVWCFPFLKPFSNNF